MYIIVCQINQFNFLPIIILLEIVSGNKSHIQKITVGTVDFQPTKECKEHARHETVIVIMT